MSFMATGKWLLNQDGDENEHVYAVASSKIFESTFSIKILHFDDSINIHVVYELILIIGEYV